MNFLTKCIASFISIPARLKGMKFGKNSFIAPGYDWLFVDLKNVVLKDDVVIGKNAWLEASGGWIIIDSGVQIGRNVMISSHKRISVGKNCLISYNVSILDADHKLNMTSESPMKSGMSKPQEIFIGDHCFIGAHSFILKGVKLGEHVIVGANSVVTKSFSKGSVIGGNPARLIRKLK
jgi:acetyltransferase-like isoleucine patch superfamily enzyme